MSMFILLTFISTMCLKFQALKIFNTFRNLLFQYDMALSLEMKVSSTALVINVKTQNLYITFTSNRSVM